MRFDQATGYVCENILNDELQTVGISRFNGSLVTENDIRREHGIQERAEN